MNHCPVIRRPAALASGHFCKYRLNVSLIRRSGGTRIAWGRKFCGTVVEQLRGPKERPFVPPGKGALVNTTKVPLALLHFLGAKPATTSSCKPHLRQTKNGQKLQYPCILVVTIFAEDDDMCAQGMSAGTNFSGTSVFGPCVSRRTSPWLLHLYTAFKTPLFGKAWEPK